ncbi:MAG: (2Fe-2S)-binding protein [Planctomycetaceae bacterium]|nr:(2Fe-2S)-binding protein [Planctomycetaceae bacterium]
MSIADLPPVTASRTVCHCIRVTEAEIENAITDGMAQSVRCVMNQTGAGTGCTACHPAIRRYLANQCPSPSSSASAPTCVMR